MAAFRTVGIFLAAVFASFAVLAAGKAQERKIYYVAANGSDDADGLAVSTAWRTLEKVNASLPAGAEVRLRRGDVFYGPLRIRSGLDVKRPTVVTAFGEGAAPEICLYKIAVPKLSTRSRLRLPLHRRAHDRR